MYKIRIRRARVDTGYMTLVFKRGPKRGGKARYGIANTLHWYLAILIILTYPTEKSQHSISQGYLVFQ